VNSEPGRPRGAWSAEPGSAGWARVLPFGDRAYLLEPDGGPQGADATAWVLAVARAAQDLWPAATVVAGLASVLVAFDSPADLPRQSSLLRGWAAPGPGAGPGPEPRVLRISIKYDGPDLGDVALLLGLTASELAARHRAADWTVAALGFSPGFGYLRSSDPLFGSIPRRADPRRRVPAGSLAIAAGMSAVYPSETPGGWHLIGTTDAVLFDVRRVPPALLRVGDRVVFEERP
jgi:KipI family sensor histidine kinase inhibitor